MIFLPEAFDEIADLVKKENILITAAEERILGYSHSEVGKLLSEKWNLPPKLTGVILHHHQPGEAGRFALETAIVHLADILCRSLNIGYGGDDKMPALDKTAWHILRIRSQSIEPLMDEISKEFKDISLFIAYRP
jgi:HD-like signal output (HDOD) protein